MKKIPEGWKNGFLGKYVTEIKDRFNGDAETPVFSVTNSQGFVLSEEYFDRQVFSKNRENYKVVKRGQFAYNPSRLNVGSLARLDDWERGLLSPMYVVFEANKSICPTFLEYWLRSGKVRALISVSTQGTVRDSVSFSTLAGFPISLPPLPEQEKITEILGSLDAAIDATRRVIEQTRTLKRALMQQLLTRGIPRRHKRFKASPLGEIPEEWEVVKIGDAGKVQAGRQRSPHFVEGIKRPYLRVANVFDGYIDTTDVLEMNFSEEEYKTYKLKNGDILLNEGQSLELVGRNAVYKGIPRNCCFQNTLVRFRANKGILSEFAYLVFQCLFHNGTFSKISLQTTSVAHLGVSRFSSLVMPIPNEEEQSKLIEIMESVESRLQKEQDYLEIIQELKTALMQTLLTGDLRIPAKSLKRKEAV